MSDQGHQDKERCLVIIAIDGHDAAYAQLGKAGFVTSPMRFSDQTCTTKKIEKKLEKMAEEIKKSNLFNQGGETIKLIISATEDSQRSLFSKLGVSVQSIEFITLLQDSTDPIQDTIDLLDNPTSEERCLGIIAIDGHGAGYAQMWKAGLVGKPMRVSDQTLSTKKIEKKLGKMAKEIKKSNLFDQGGETINELIISATEDSQRSLFRKLGVSVQSIEFITLLQDSTNPIQDTIDLLDNPTRQDYVKKKRAKFEKMTDHFNTQNTSNNDQSMGAQLPGSPQVGRKEEDQLSTRSPMKRNTFSGPDNSSVQEEKPQEMNLIIAINEVGAAYVQMYKEGQKIEPSVIEDPKFVMENYKGRKLEWLVDWINKNILIEKGKGAEYDLIIYTTDFYKHYSKHFDGLHVKPKSIKFESLPEGGTDPFQESLDLVQIPSVGSKDYVSPMKKVAPAAPVNASPMNEQEIVTDQMGSDENKEILENILSYVRSIELELKQMRKDKESMNQKLDDQTQSIKNLELELRKDKEERPTTLIRNSSVKSKAPPAPRPSITDLRCHFHPAPVRVQQIQSQFSDKLTRMLSKEKHQVQECASGPTIFFCVNSSRILSDIQRDLKSGDAIADFKGPIFMLFIKPTNKPEEASERLDPSTWGYEKVKEAAFLLVDTNTRHLHECATNEASLESVIKFLKR